MRMARSLFEPGRRLFEDLDLALGERRCRQRKAISEAASRIDVAGRNRMSSIGAV